MAVPTEWDCMPDGGDCYWHGDFVSSDRAITYRDIRLHGRGWYKYEGKPVAALYEGSSLTGPLVFRVGDRSAWVPGLPVLIISYAVTLGLVLFAVSTTRERLASRRWRP